MVRTYRIDICVYELSNLEKFFIYYYYYYYYYSQQQIVGRYAEPEDGSLKHQHKKSVAEMDI